MAYQVNNDTRIEEVLELVLSQGFNGLPEILRQIFNKAMEVERQRYLQAKPYERTEERKSYANGYKPKQLKTRIGELGLQIPQTRDSQFYPSCLERGMRSERALKLAVAEMYFQGVLMRKVAAIMQELCGFELTSTEVSQAAKLLDEDLAQWRDRPLESFAYIYLDALYEKVRYGGHVRDVAVLVAIGVNAQGYREILGLSVALSEQEVHWRDFLISLQERGLKGMELFISDDHAGLKAARKAVFPSIPWQRCQFHLQQNAQAYVMNRAKKREVAGMIRAILTAPDDRTARELLAQAVKHYETSMPKLSAWMEKSLPESFAHFPFPEEHHRRIRTSNVLERLNKEIRRRTRVVNLFPNVESCQRLISAVLTEIHDDWVTGKKYLTKEV
jgi:putative transposase